MSTSTAGRTSSHSHLGPEDVNEAAATTLEEELRAVVRGEVRFDDGSRGLYSTDASNYRQVPVGVVIAKDADDIVQTVTLCHKREVPILSRGGGTSLAGQCCNSAVVIDFSKYMNRIIEIDQERKTARVQPGVVLDDLRDAAEQYNLTYGPDPATHNRCTLGGMIGNNSCGVHSLLAGMTDENIEELEVLTYDGLRLRVGKTTDAELATIIRRGGREAAIYARLKDLRDKYEPLIREKYPDIPRRVSGYSLPALLPENGFDVARALVGSEATCVVVLEATVKLVYSPPERTLVVLGYTDIYTACDHVPDILEHKPTGLEGFDDQLVHDMQKKDLLPEDVALLPEGGGWLLVEFGGKTREEANEAARGLLEALGKKDGSPHSIIFDDPVQASRIWKVREAGLGATARVPGQPDEWPGWEDSSVPPARLGNYLRDFRALLERYGYECSFYGHFGQGCVHVRIDFDFQSAEGIRKFRDFMHDAAHMVVGYGGSLSGEHGDGQARAELLPIMFGDELVAAFREFKAIWDPDGKMNPGKIVDPCSIDDNLRLAGYKPAKLRTHFKFPDDEGSFARAALRCVGVGACRKHDSGTMCPSYMATRDEADSTRGRARLLFEMIKGEVVQNGWRDEHVKDSLDLCLACKGCKGECPVQVDMATYKSEFLSHYYATRLRPPAAYTMGLIHWWARLASLAPGAANFVTQARPLSQALKKLTGIAPQRRMPRFARETFKQWYARHRAEATTRPSAAGQDTTNRVILWPDTFNNHFHPGTARSALEVLAAAGCEVVVPCRPLCCGRPLYDWGMLNQAKYLLRQILRALADEIDAGTPVVVLEPSCASVFREELVNLFPGDQRARRLSKQTYLLSEFLNRMQGYRPPKLAGTALVHGHCHHKAIMKMGDEEDLLGKMGVDARTLDSGCCGMAGAFGFEAKHYAVSLAVGERVLLPAVREAGPDTMIIADGFSCREQISQSGGREAIHLADALRIGLRAESKKRGT